MDFFNTAISEDAKLLVQNVLDSSFISAGKLASEFERRLEADLGLINAVSVNSGTSALHLSLILAKIGKGDEVIIPAQTFIATGIAVLMVGAMPVFADIQKNSGNIDPVSVESKITNKTKAIIPVHWGGYPCDLEELQNIAKKYNLQIIEDAAHALGATYQNQKIGTISDFTCFSFQAIKHLTTGDGGLICTTKKNAYHKAKKLRWFGIDRDKSMVSKLGEREYDLDELGYKYHMNDFSAALGLGNLSDLTNNLERRKYIAEYYSKELNAVSGVKLLERKNDRESANWLFTILVENRNDFVKLMKNSNIPVSVVHQRIDKNSLFGGLRKDLCNQFEFDRMQISIPVHNSLSNENIEYIIENIKKGW